MVWQEMQDCRKEQKNGLNEKKSPQSNKAQPQREQAIKGWEIRKQLDAIKSQGWTAECADEPPDHCEHMSSRQVLDICKS